jgi:tetratricopeptide (TPR) repeat protein
MWMFLLFAQDAAILSSQGAEAMRQQRFADAAAIYRKLVEAEASNPMWRLNLGLALYSSKQYPAASAELERFLRARPEPGPAHLVLGASWLRMGRECEAITPLQTGVKWRPSKETWIQLADAFAGCKQYTDAAKAYSQAGDERLAARSYWQARDYSSAVDRFRRIEDRFANDPEFLYEFGDSLVRQSGVAAGIAYLERSVKADPSLLPARAELGKALLEADRAAEAIPHLEAASAEDPTLLLPLSRAYRAEGRTEDATRVQNEYRKRLAGGK